MSIDGKIRIDWIDTLKLVGIFYIYLGHLGNDAGKLYPFVFSFHVPLFFFISGLFFKIPDSLNDSAYVIKKAFYKIVIPYAAFSLIGIAFYTIKWNYPTERVLEMLYNAFMGVRNKVPMASLWFLPCLFVVISYYVMAVSIIKRPVIIFASSLIIYCLTPYWFNKPPTQFFNIDSALHYLSYFSLGVLLSKKVKYEWPAKYENKNNLLIVAFIIASFAYFAYSYQNGTFYVIKDIKQSELKYLLIFLITCVMFIPSIAISYWLNIKALNRLGENTLALCGTEQILKISIISFFGMLGLNIQFKDPIQAIAFVILCLIVSYFTVIKIYTSFSLKKHSNT